MVGALAAMVAGAAPKTNGAGTAQTVITVRPVPGDDRAHVLDAGDISVVRGNTTSQITHVERLAGNFADMQLFILLDDSSRSTLSLQFPELRTFLKSLPATTQVAVGYMRNGSFSLAQAFTADHDKAGQALRLPESIPGANGSPYFVFSDLAKHWPSKEPTNRRVILTLTDGVDPYYAPRIWTIRTGTRQSMTLLRKA
jgi:hypothetical protein